MNRGIYMSVPSGVSSIAARSNGYRSMGETATPETRKTVQDFINSVLAAARGLSQATQANVPPASGGTAISAADFVVRGSVCKPANVTALVHVQELQRQLNRVAQVKGFSKIAADGEVGPATITLFARVQAAAGAARIPGATGACVDIAPKADVLRDQVKQYADSIGAPAQASAPIAFKAPTIVTPTGQEVAVGAGVFDTFNQLGTVEKVAIVGVFGGIGYMLLKKARKR